MLEKIKNLEFLRTLGCISIVLLHFFIPLSSKFPLVWNCNYLLFGYNTSNGDKAVDLFFILSGLFFTIKITSTLKMQSLYEFVKKKVLRLWPVLIWVIFLDFILSLTGIINFSFLGYIITLLGLNGNGIGIQLGYVSVFWYVSAMLWVLILYFYLLKNFDKKKVNLVIALLIYFSYVFLLHVKDGHIGSHIQTFYFIFNVGILRALGGIGIGYFIGEWYKNNLSRIKTLTLSIKSTIILTIIELGCLYFIIKNLIISKLRFPNQFIFMIFFSAIIVLFLWNKGYISKALSNNFSLFLGKYTYSIYMTHNTIIKLLNGTIWEYHPEIVFKYPVLNIVIGLFAIFILGVFTYHFIEKPMADIILKKQSANQHSPK